MAQKKDSRVLTLGGREVTISNPGKVYFEQAGVTKGELVDYDYAAGSRVEEE